MDLPPKLPPKELPEELQRHIVARSLECPEYAQIVRDIRAHVTPHGSGAKDNPFFTPNPALAPCVHIRAPQSHPGLANVPPLLRPMYASYEPTVEFTFHETTFFSLEHQQEARPCPEFIDLGMRYAGMGHVFIHSYHLPTGRMITLLDGGSNGWDQEENHKRRVRQLTKLNQGVDNVKSLEPWEALHATFGSWWMQEFHGEES